MNMTLKECLEYLNQRDLLRLKNQKKADIVVFNTCAIRQKAEQKFLSSLGRIKHLKKKNPELKIIVAGCVAQLQGEKLLDRVPYIDYIIGPDNIHMIENILENQISNKIFTDENPLVANIKIPAKRMHHVKAWVNIMYGCNNYCAYCVVPYTRGRERSRPVESILEEIRLLGESGFKEITLLGQNVNSYRDGDIDFPSLLEKN